MRAIQLIAIMTMTSLGQAQNWTVIDPAYKYNYSNDGTDTISDQIFATHIDTLGVDSFRYVLNRVARPIGPTSSSESNCYSSFDVQLNAPQFLGGEVVRTGSGHFLIGSDTLQILVEASVGQQWTGPGGITGVVQIATMTDILGEPDSVKWMDFSNGASIALSKEHGIIGHVRNGEEHDLIGIQGDLQLGVRFPTLADLFTYQPGDILEYRGDGSGTDGTCEYYSHYTIRYEVMERTDLLNSTEYLIHKTANDQNWGVPLSGWGNCGSSTQTTDMVVALIVDHHAWTPDNFLGNHMLDFLWPEAFTVPDPNSDPGAFALYETGIRWRATKNDLGRFVLESDKLDGTDLEPAPTIFPCVQDSLGSLAFERHTIRFVEGIGRTRVEGYYFEHSLSDSLWAYSIGGEQVGTFTPVDIILGMEDQEGSTLNFFPNPVNDQIHLSKTTTGSAARITDLNGRLVLQRLITSELDIIDVTALQPGAYLFHLTGFAPQRFMVVR